MGALTTYLLDTHAFLWWVFDAPELSSRARGLMADPQQRILVSSATAWEIAIKFRSGKLAAVAPFSADIAAVVRRAGFLELPISFAHANRAGLLPGEHRDPFDRMLAAQSLCEDCAVIGCDPALTALGATQMW